MRVSSAQIIERFPSLLSYVRGDSQALIKAPCSYTHPFSEGLAFVPDEAAFDAVKDSSLSAMVLEQKILKAVENKGLGDLPQRLCVLSANNLQLAMALVIKEFFTSDLYHFPFGSKGIHPTAYIDPTAQIGPEVVVGPLSVIGPRVKIGSATQIGAHVTIEGEAEIGQRCRIHSQVFIGQRCQLGDECEIKPQSAIGTDGFGHGHDEKGQHYRKPHLGRVVLGNRVELGCGVYIDRGVFEDSVIGEGTKVDNYCHFGHNIKMGKNCLVTAGFASAGSVEVGDNCIFGGRTGVNGHIKICSNTTFAALSGIVNSVDKPGIYGGFPVQDYKHFLKSQASIPKLPEMRKKLIQIMKHLGMTTEE